MIVPKSSRDNLRGCSAMAPNSGSPRHRTASQRLDDDCQTAQQSSIGRCCNHLASPLESTAGVVKFGILSTVSIARKACVSLSEATNATCVAVASRDQAKAEAFVKENCPSARAYGSYQALLDDEEIQAVYIPLETAARAEWIVKAAAKKKHVLGEKPIAANASEAKACIDACKTAGVQFMDNTMFMHNVRTNRMRVVMDDEAFGVPKHVVTSFSIPFAATSEEFATSNIRMKKAKEPLGALGDLGWYNVRFTLWAFGFENPEAVSCHYTEKTDEGVPLCVLANLKFPGGRTASLDCSFKHGWRNWAEVASENCHLRVEDFVVPARSDVCSFTVVKGDCGDKALTFTQEAHTEEFRDKAQHVRLMEKFASIVSSGELEEHWPNIALQTNMVILAMAASAKQQGSWITF